MNKARSPRISLGAFLAPALLLPWGCIVDNPDWNPSTGQTAAGAGDATETTGTTGSDRDGSDTAANTTAGAQTVLLEFAPSIAACSDPTRLDPMLCRENRGFVVDLYDDDIGAATTGYLRFDLTGQAIDGPILAASLFLTNSDSLSPESGEVWQTETFTAEDLTMGQPMTIGEVALAPTVHEVELGQSIEFPLPTTVLDADTPLCLAIVPTSTNGVEYWALGGDVPPRLTLLVEAP